MENGTSLLTTNYHTIARNAYRDQLVAAFSDQRLQQSIKPLMERVVSRLWDIMNDDSDEMLPVEDSEVGSSVMNILAEKKYYRLTSGDSAWSKGFDSAFRELQAKIFTGDSDADYGQTFHSELCEWLEEELAIAIFEDERFKPLSVIQDLMQRTHSLYQFFQAFIERIPSDWVLDERSEWIKVDNQVSIQERIVSTKDEDYFERLERDWLTEPDKDSFRSVSKAAKSSEYAMFNDAYVLKCKVLLKHDMKGLLEFIEGLYSPAVQDVAFHYIDDPDKILNILEELVGYESSLRTSKKQLAYLLLSNFFEKSIKISQNLNFYHQSDERPCTDSRDYDEATVTAGRRIAEQWFAGSPARYDNLFRLASELLDTDQIGDWVLSYSPQVHGGEGYRAIFNKELRQLTDSFATVLLQSGTTPDKLFTDDFSFQKLDLIVRLLRDKISSEQASGYISSLVSLLFKNDFYWDMEFSESSWPAIKGLGFLLSKLDDPLTAASQLIRKFTTYFEGWGALATRRIVSLEVFILCGVSLLLEYPEVFAAQERQSSYFNNLATHVLRQNRFAHRYAADYNLVLILLSLIAHQVMPAEKVGFEKKLLEEIDQIKALILIFSNEDYKLEDENLGLFTQRANEEWAFEKSKMELRNQSYEIEQIENQLFCLMRK